MNLPCILCDMVAEGRLEWTPTHDRSLWPQLSFEKQKQMAAAHGLQPVTERRDTAWRPIRNPTYIPAPTPLELETDWVTWIEENVPDDGHCDVASVTKRHPSVLVPCPCGP